MSIMDPYPRGQPPSRSAGAGHTTHLAVLRKKEDWPEAAEHSRCSSVLWCFDELSSAVASSVCRDDLFAVQDTDTGIRGGQREVFVRCRVRKRVIIEVESNVDAFLATEGLEQLRFESVLG